MDDGVNTPERRLEQLKEVLRDAVDEVRFVELWRRTLPNGWVDVLKVDGLRETLFRLDRKYLVEVARALDPAVPSGVGGTDSHVRHVLSAMLQWWVMYGKWNPGAYSEYISRMEAAEAAGLEALAAAHENGRAGD